MSETKKLDALRERAKADLRVLICIVWHYLGLPPPTPAQLDIAYYLMHAGRREILQAFRGIGKSFIIAVFAIWRVLRNYQTRVLVNSASSDRAVDTVLFIRRLLSEVPILKIIEPLPISRKNKSRDSILAFDIPQATTDQSSTFRARGILGMNTGSRSDLIIGDDIEIPSNSETQLKRDKLISLIDEFTAIIKPLPTSQIILLGTPQVHASLYNTLQEKGYNTRIWTARKPADESVYKGRLAPFVTNSKIAVGEPIDPMRFDDAELSDRLMSYGKVGFDLQFMLNTSLHDRDKYPLKISDFIVTSCSDTHAFTQIVHSKDVKNRLNEVTNVALDNDFFYAEMWHNDVAVEYTNCIMSIDPSGRGTNETGYTVIKECASMLYITKIGGLLGGYNTATLTKLANIAKVNNIKKIVVEANFGDGMYTQLLSSVVQEIHSCEIEEVKHNRQKELRIIDTIEPPLSSHRLVLDINAIEDDYKTAETIEHSCIYQLTRLTADKNSLKLDDRLDALAIGINYFTEIMKRDTSRAAEMIDDELFDIELEKFHEQVIGEPSPIKNNIIADHYEI